MEATEMWISAPVDKPMKISRWKVKAGSKVGRGALLAIYETSDTKGLKLKSTMVGTVLEIAESKEFFPPGTNLVKMQSCAHPTVMKDMCAECGADLRKDAGVAGSRKEPVSASVAMVHNIPELIISQEQALELGKADEERLFKTRKLVLLVDLDQTLIHTTNDDIPVNLKDVFHFQLRHGNVIPWYHTKLRPGTESFLEKISKMYEMHICTFGSRMYAHIIAKFLDPRGKYFSHRILSRDECFNQNSKTANLKALFPCGDSMVCIIDDREDVWNFSPNLIHVKPYRFFQGTADINAPPGLDKTEHDTEPVKHKVVRTVSRSNSKEDDKPSCRTAEEKDIDGAVQPDGSDLMVKNKVHTDTDNSNENGQKSVPVQEDGEGIKSINNKENAENSPPVGIQTAYNDKEENVSLVPEIKEEGIELDEKCLEKYDDAVIIEDIIENSKDEGVENKKSECMGKSPSVIVQDNDMKEKDENSYNNVDSSANLEASKKTEEDEKEEIEWIDEDDYLLYLEDILTKIHRAFYDIHDQIKSKAEESAAKADLKHIIPYVKRKVLKGVNLLFSGVIPTNQPLEKSRAYQVAKTLGANVQKDFVPRKKSSDHDQNATTHVVAAKLGTVKVKTAQKHKWVRLVSIDWLWTCAERVERCDERIFPVLNCDSPSVDAQVLNQKKRKTEESSDTKPEEQSALKRIKVDCNTSTDNDDYELSSYMDTEDNSTAENNVSTGDCQAGSSSMEDTDIIKKQFSDSYNPILAFSDEDIACMDKEVELTMEEEEDDSEEEDVDRDSRIRSQVLSSGDDEDSSSGDSLTGETPRGWNIKRNRRSKSDDSASSDHEIDKEVRAGDEESENELDKFEQTVAAFAPDSDRESDEDSIGSVDDEMAAAVEREFLSRL